MYREDFAAVRLLFLPFLPSRLRKSGNVTDRLKKKQKKRTHHHINNDDVEMGTRATDGTFVYSEKRHCCLTRTD